MSDEGGAAAPARGTRWIVAARIAFLAAVVAFGWLWLREDWDDVVAAMREVSAVSLALALLLVLAGLVLTGFVWVRCLRRFGHDVPLAPAMSVFFVGQLGKYIPGSVWSLGAQAQMAVRYGVPARTTVAAGLVFLGWNVVTAAFVTSVGVVAGGAVDLPRWLGAAGVVLSLIAMAPPLVNAAGSWAAGSGRRLALSAFDCAVVVVLLLATWSLYGLALHAVSPDAGPTYSVGAAMVAFTAAYAVGVLVVLAPAGLGAREAMLTFLLTPFLGVGGAAAAALVTRLVHTAADFSIAGAAWILGRARRAED